MKIGFIGTGIMGKPMAANLQKAGHQLYFSEHRRPAPAELIDAGGQGLPTLTDVAKAAEIIIVMVPNAPQVEEVLFADDGLMAGLSAGKIVIDMSSISHIATRQFASRVNASGADYLDAPVSGGETGAINGTLSIMVGGSEAAFEKALPVFEGMGSNITLVGGNGDGQVAKLANQIVVALTIEGTAEALMFAAKAGANPSRVRTALMGGFASSKILELHGERMINRHFAPGFRVALQQKDLDTVLEAARSMAISLPNTASTQQLYNACTAMNGSDGDHSSLVLVLEEMANLSLDEIITED